MKLKHIFIVIFLFLSTALYSQEYFTLSGVITNAQTGKTLDGIDIVVKNQLTGTISNYKGAYILYLNKGTYDVSYSATGYKAQKIEVKLNDDQVQMVELTPKSKLSTKTKKLKRRLIPLKPANDKILSANNRQKIDTIEKTK